jgi:hypothetical protein
MHRNHSMTTILARRMDTAGSKLTSRWCGVGTRCITNGWRHIMRKERVGKPRTHHAHIGHSTHHSAHHPHVGHAHVRHHRSHVGHTAHVRHSHVAHVAHAAASATIVHAAAHVVHSGHASPVEAIAHIATHLIIEGHVAARASKAAVHAAGAHVTAAKVAVALVEAIAHVAATIVETPATVVVEIATTEVTALVGETTASLILFEIFATGRVFRMAEIGVVIRLGVIDGRLLRKGLSGAKGINLLLECCCGLWGLKTNKDFAVC